MLMGSGGVVHRGCGSQGEHVNTQQIDTMTNTRDANTEASCTLATAASKGSLLLSELVLDCLTAHLTNSPTTITVAVHTVNECSSERNRA